MYFYVDDNTDGPLFQYCANGPIQPDGIDYTQRERCGIHIIVTDEGIYVSSNNIRFHFDANITKSQWNHVGFTFNHEYEQFQ